MQNAVQVEPGRFLAPNGVMWVKCPECRGWVRDKRIFGTLHICDLEAQVTRQRLGVYTGLGSRGPK